MTFKSKTTIKTWVMSSLAIIVMGLSACDSKTDRSTVAGTDGEALTEVTIALDWVPNTNHTGLYVAQDLGYFTEQGLNVSIVQPSEDSSSAIVANNRADFGIYFQPNMIKRLEKGMPITAVAAILQHNTAGLMSQKSLGATSPKDLNGKRYSTWEDPIDDATVAYIVGNDSVKIPGEATDASTAMRMNQFDYILAFYGWDGIHAKLKGLDVNFFFLKDFEPAFDYYTPIIIANNELLKTKPELARKTLDAIEQGYLYAAKHPDASAEILLKYAPETNKELALASQRYLSSQYLDENGQWGRFDYSRWDRFFDWVYDQGLIDKPMPPQAGVTNDYL